MRPADRPFDARKEDEPAFPRVRRVRRRVEVAIVQRHGERAVAERDRAVDERSRRVRDAIGRVVVCMRVKFELDHRAKSSSPWPSAGLSGSDDVRCAGACGTSALARLSGVRDSPARDLCGL